MTTLRFHRRQLAAFAWSGFSLIELLIAMSVASVLLAFGVPGYQGMVGGYQLSNHAQFLAGTLNQARSEAIKRSQRVNVCKTYDAKQCAAEGSWASGWILFVDTNRNGQIDPGEQILHIEGPVANRITLSGNHPVEDYVSYTSMGNARMLNGALQMGTFVACKAGQSAIKIVLANSGRARVEKTALACV